MISCPFDVLRELFVCRAVGWTLTILQRRGASLLRWCQLFALKLSHRDFKSDGQAAEGVKEMVLDDQVAAVEEEESDDEAIDMEVCTTFIFVKNDVFLFLLLFFTLNNFLSRILSRVESLKRTLGWSSPLSRYF